MLNIKNIKQIRKKTTIETPSKDKLLLFTENKASILGDDYYKISYADFAQYLINSLPAPIIPIVSGDVTGDVRAFLTTTIPSNYLWANGSIELISAYPDLFDKIGATYGGDGVTTFGIPDLTGRFIVGDNGANFGSIVGDNLLTEGQLPQITPVLYVSTDTSGHSIMAVGDGLGSSAGGVAGRADIYNTNQTTTISLAGFDTFGNDEEHFHPQIRLRYAICFQSLAVGAASPTPSFGAVLGVNPDSNILASYNGVPYATVNDSLPTNSTLQIVSNNGGFDNGSTVRQGGRDNGLGGGVSLVCSVDKEFQFENGVQYYLSSFGGSIVHANSMNGDIPDASYDDTRGFIVGSRYTNLITGNTYQCTDSTTGAALWDLVLSGANATLDLVTTTNNVTTNDIYVGDMYLYNPNSPGYDKLSFRDTVFIVSNPSSGAGDILLVEGGLITSRLFDSVIGGSLNFGGLTASRQFYLQDKTYTIAGLDDVITGAILEQIHTSGPTVIIDNVTTILYVDPASTIASLTIIMPETPINGQEVKISFGGTLVSGTVATVLAVVGNTGQSVLAGVSITEAIAGDGYILKYQESLNLWRLFY